MLDSSLPWKTAPERAALNEKTVDIWRVPLDPLPDVLLSLIRLLSADERARAERFHFAQERRRFLAARGALRTILSHYLSTPAAEIRFSYSLRGKPGLGGLLANHPLRFNLAHAHELALCVVALGRRVGIDLEYIRPLNDMDTIAQRFFAEREVRTLQALPVAARQVAFFRCWARKEAYIKAIGEGLSQPLDQFAVSLAADEPPRLLWVAGDNEGPARWTLIDVPADSQYCGALAVAGNGFAFRFWQWTARIIKDSFKSGAEG